MKSLPSKQLTASGLTTCMLIIMLLVTTTVYAASQNYHGLTTVYYTNKVTDQGAVFGMAAIMIIQVLRDLWISLV